jgi:hypothetical protein
MQTPLVPVQDGSLYAKIPRPRESLLIWYYIEAQLIGSRRLSRVEYAHDDRGGKYQWDCLKGDSMVSAYMEMVAMSWSRSCGLQSPSDGDAVGTEVCREITLQL